MRPSWQALQDGDIVDIVAPGWATSNDVLRKGIEFLKAWNLKPRVPSRIFQKNLLFSNSDDNRWRHFKAALQAKDSKVIWCLRGGYGSLRVLPELKKMKRPQQTKLLIGISDITSLHTYLNEYWGWPTLHGSLLDRLGENTLPRPIQNEMKRILWGKQDQVEFKGIKALNSAAEKVKTLKAPIVGGNLITLQSAIGTPYDFNTSGKMLFLEDIGERGYALDRALVHCLQAGKLKNCKAILLGQFVGGAERDGRSLVMPALKNFAREINIPVFSGIQSGHGVQLRPLPFNTKAQIKKERSFKLVVETGVVLP